ncbi:ABC transporter permease [Longimycelium tulufanense]|uniref:ABC transporter permease n=1 Tax=Longimycelium tulufanense TaxID=907463 RepID=A0A8J3CH91_9PSEU|nr:ABC transporter permease [Longimycelium tulufanense]GGM75033.1 ABC transporter permease [Longimycelium tulufanense]
MTPPTPLSPARAVWLVSRRELNTRVRSKAFLFGTLALVLVIALYAGLMFFMGKSSNTSTIGFTGQATVVSEPLKNSLQAMGKDVETQSVPDVRSGERLVSEGKLDALVAGAPGALKVIVEDGLGDSLRSALDGVARQQALDAQLAEAGLDVNKVNREVAAAGVEVQTLKPVDPERGQRMMLAFAVVFLLFFSIQTVGQLVAQGVVEEKSSRVVEILLSTVRPWQLLLGKVLGVGLVGLIQLVVVGALGLVAASATGVLTIQGVAFGTLMSALGWYVLGFFLVATMLASAAALVSRQEDLSSVITPVVLTLVLAFVVGINLLTGNPQSPWVEWLSLIPPFSPIIMPGRAALGLAPAWQVAMAVVITIAALAAVLWLGSRIYRNAVLRTGARVKLRDALKAE